MILYIGRVLLVGTPGRVVYFYFLHPVYDLGNTERSTNHRMDIVIAKVMARLYYPNSYYTCMKSGYYFV